MPHDDELLTRGKGCSGKSFMGEPAAMTLPRLREGFSARHAVREVKDRRNESVSFLKRGGSGYAVDTYRRDAVAFLEK